MNGIIDAHLHLWDRARSEYSWITPDLGDLYADFPPPRAEEELEAAGVSSAILVQAEDSLADTRYLVEVANANPWVVGVVGWVPLDQPEMAAQALDEWTQHPVIRGVRQLVHIDPRDDLLDDPAVLATLRLVGEAGFAFDVPDAWPRHLHAVPRIADAVPDLTIVVDHFAKPPMAGFDEWERAFTAAAAHPSTTTKLSGLQGLPEELVRRAWDVALTAFGPDRIAYGGDWPMTIMTGGYASTKTLVDELLASLSVTERTAVYRGTAARVYGLEP